MESGDTPLSSRFRIAILLDKFIREEVGKNERIEKRCDVVIQLKPDQEQLIGQAIQAGLIATAEQVLDLGVESIRLRLESHRSQSRQEEIDAAVDRLINFREKHRLSLNGLAIKDLINEGRR